MLEQIKKDYRLIRKIGQGGMAQIFLAQEYKNQNFVAIKIVKSDKSTDIYRRRFLLEMKTLKTMDSPYIVKYYKGVYEKDFQYMVMEYVQGKVLRDQLKDKVRFSPQETVNFAKQLALGFSEIHKKGIIHRDIKSSNIIITTHNRVKIIDFGIALQDDSTRVTKENVAIGSPHYMPPEIVARQEPTAQSDIYSFGILLFEMLTGSTPFKAPNSTDLAYKHLNEVVPQVNKIISSVPQSLANILTKATAKDLAFRYKTMREIYNDLVTCFDSKRNNEKPITSSGKVKQDILTLITSKKFGIAIWITIAFISGLLLGLLFFLLG